MYECVIHNVSSILISNWVHSLILKRKWVWNLVIHYFNIWKRLMISLYNEFVSEIFYVEIWSPHAHIHLNVTHWLNIKQSARSTWLKRSRENQPWREMTRSYLNIWWLERNKRSWLAASEQQCKKGSHDQWQVEGELLYGSVFVWRREWERGGLHIEGEEEVHMKLWVREGWGFC